MKNNHISFRVQARARTDKGRRPNNEDFVTSFEPTNPQERQQSGCIYIVADGVGGASVGERASKYAAEKVLYEYFQHPEMAPGPRLKQVISRVNREIYKYAHDKGIRMATTMAVAVVLDHSLIAANVGDSRVYLIRHNEVSQITQDHNIVGEMVRDGVVTEAEALKNKAKNRLTRSIGGDEEVHVDIFGPIPLQAGDKIVLCSDGLTRYALKEDIANLAASGSPEQITENLVAFAKNRGRGGADNISVITVAYEPDADLEAILSTPRPEAPEQPWEILETIIVPKPQAPRTLSGKWFALSASGLGILFIATIAILFAIMPGIFPLMGTAPTQTSTITITPSANLTITPTTIPPATPSGTPVTPSPPAVAQVTPPSTAIPSIDCSSNNDPVNVRSSPSNADNTKILGKLICGDKLTLTGRYVPEDSTRDWYQISFIETDGKPVLAWVIANRVSIPPEDKASYPLLDYFGMTVTPSLQPQGTTPAPGAAQISTPGNCIYTVIAGDVLSIIAQKFGVADVKSIICKADSPGCDLLSDPNQIKPGWQVIIPGIAADVCSQQGGDLPLN